MAKFFPTKKRQHFVNFHVSPCILTIKYAIELRRYLLIEAQNG